MPVYIRQVGLCSACLCVLCAHIPGMHAIDLANMPIMHIRTFLSAFIPYWTVCLYTVPGDSHMLGLCAYKLAPLPSLPGLEIAWPLALRRAYCRAIGGGGGGLLRGILKVYIFSARRPAF
jgi:hypothetical protein